MEMDILQIANRNCHYPDPGINKFWNTKCTYVRVDNDQDLDEVLEVLKLAQISDRIKARKTLK